jgi:hypothetical protein
MDFFSVTRCDADRRKKEDTIEVVEKDWLFFQQMLSVAMKLNQMYWNLMRLKSEKERKG